MSRVVGNIKNIFGVAASTRVRIEPLSQPVVVNGSLIWPETKIVQATVLGNFAVTLVYGNYRVWVEPVYVDIAVPDDELTYPLEELITSDLYAPTPPPGVGGTVATPSAFGLVKADTNVANPVAVTGLFDDVTNVADLMTRGYGANNKRAWLRTPGAGEAREYYWASASVAAHDGTSVVNPTGNPGAGRWLPW